ncbi:hypothetical protein [Enterobacter hormaechei]|uniref:hypothetical protein n=1 Tax=Enterobacter hormaechei TaxID=158836 RepID=UPI0012523530|nr:hypothetical protein [Enterobacter hormaechei]QLO98697.1 hypothetical protein HV047_13955 [Enterobacter hormaechei]VAM33237.1 Uncharacterised protein [Enterobacter hormaechei]
MSVKRYEWMACDEHACHCDVVESAEGDMVDYEDYAALEARCAALAAENAGLKSAISEHSEGFTVCPCCGTEHDSCHDDVCRALNETPATDAFLAELRAAAVDEVCLKISNAIVNCYQDEQVGLDAAATICGDFAAQLRKGVQS